MVEEAGRYWTARHRIQKTFVSEIGRRVPLPVGDGYVAVTDLAQRCKDLRIAGAVKADVVPVTDCEAEEVELDERTRVVLRRVQLAWQVALMALTVLGFASLAYWMALSRIVPR